MASDGNNGVGVKWECPICFLLPRKEIYSCINGHSMCVSCINSVDECPFCKVNIKETRKVRNRELETLLNTTKLKCCWNGCDAYSFRGDISEHEENCPHNPIVLKICPFFSSHHNSCNFQFTMESLHDACKVERILEHLKSHGIHEMKMSLNRRAKEGFPLDDLRSPNPNSSTKKYEHQSIFSETLVSLNYKKKKHLFLQNLRIYGNRAGQDVLSIMFIQLTPDIKWENSPFKVNLCIETVPKEDEILNWGPSCSATTTWAIKPMKIDRFMEHCQNLSAEQPSFPSPILMSQLENYCIGENNTTSYSYSISAD